MGVEHKAVAGFTVDIPKDKLHEKMIEVRAEDLDEMFTRLKIHYETTGSCWTGDESKHPLFVPDNALNLETKLQAWLDNLNVVFKTSMTLEDVYFLKDLMEY